jgi:hypothetical protein
MKLWEVQKVPKGEDFWEENKHAWEFVRKSHEYHFNYEFKCGTQNWSEDIGLGKLKIYFY